MGDRSVSQARAYQASRWPARGSASFCVVPGPVDLPLGSTHPLVPFASSTLSIIIQLNSCRNALSGISLCFISHYVFLLLFFLILLFFICFFVSSDSGPFFFSRKCVCECGVGPPATRPHLSRFAHLWVLVSSPAWDQPSDRFPILQLFRSSLAFISHYSAASSIIAHQRLCFFIIPYFLVIQVSNNKPDNCLFSITLSS